MAWHQVEEWAQEGGEEVIPPASRGVRRRVARLKARDLAGQAKAKEG